MKTILKKIIYRLFKPVHSIIESMDNEKRLAGISAMSTIDPSTSIALTARIINHRHDPSKIIAGKNCWLRGEMMLAKHGGKIVIGDFVFFGEHSRIWSSAQVTIGNHVLISHNVNIHDYDSHPLDLADRITQSEFVLSTHALPDSDFGVGEKEIVIQDGAWICFNAVILKGVTIGQGAIVAASAVVTTDVPPFTIVAGNPARVIKNLRKTI